MMYFWKNFFHTSKIKLRREIFILLKSYLEKHLYLFKRLIQKSIFVTFISSIFNEFFENAYLKYTLLIQIISNDKIIE